MGAFGISRLWHHKGSEIPWLAQEIRAARERGEESGLSEDEIAFYDALADNQSARDLMGEPALRVIAHELVQDIRRNMTVDWAHRESTRADIRRRVKRILRKYGYPPNLQDEACRMCCSRLRHCQLSWFNLLWLAFKMVDDAVLGRVALGSRGR
jgi:type I restriction enzyme R subunit